MGIIWSCAGLKQLNCHFPLWKSALWASGLEALDPFASSEYRVAEVCLLLTSDDFEQNQGLQVDLRARNIKSAQPILNYFRAWAWLQNRLWNRKFLEIKSGLIRL